MPKRLYINTYPQTVKTCRKTPNLICTLQVILPNDMYGVSGFGFGGCWALGLIVRSSTGLRVGS